MAGMHEVKLVKGCRSKIMKRMETTFLTNKIIGAGQLKSGVKLGIDPAAILQLESPVVDKRTLKAAMSTICDVVGGLEKELGNASLETTEEKMAYMWDAWNMMFQVKNGFGFRHGQSDLFSIAMSKKIMDGDTFSMLSMVMARKLDLPLFLASAPGMLFVRWEDPASKFNFKGGSIPTDEDLIDGTGITVNMLKKRGYLKSMTRDEVKSTVIFNRALYRILQGNQEKAINDNKKSIKDFKEAIKDLTLVIKKKNSDPEAVFHRGMAHMLSDKNIDALLDMSTAISLNPNNGSAYMMRSRIKQELLASDLQHLSAKGDMTPEEIEIFRMAELKDIRSDWEMGAIKIGRGPQTAK